MKLTRLFKQFYCDSDESHQKEIRNTVFELHKTECISRKDYDTFAEFFYKDTQI